MTYTKDFYEQYAVAMLGFYFPEFSSLKKGESPDFYNENIGLEVRRAITPKDGEMDAFWKNNHDKTYDSLSQKQLQKLGFVEPPVPTDNQEILYMQRSKIAGTLFYLKNKDDSVLVLCCYMGKVKEGSFSMGDIEIAVSEKLLKLNQNYTLHEENDALILIQDQLQYLWPNNEIVELELQVLIEKLKIYYNSGSYQVTFDKIILMFSDNIFVIDTNCWIYKRAVISQENIDAVLARVLPVNVETKA